MSKLSLRTDTQAARNEDEEPRLKFSYHGVFQNRKTEPQGRPMSPESRAGSSSRRRTVEEELLTLQALEPKLAEDLPLLFEEAVTDSLMNILGESEGRALVVLIGEANFASPAKVFQVLDAFFQDASSILKDVIAREFHANVHLLLEKVKAKIKSELESPSTVTRMTASIQRLLLVLS